MAPRPPPPQTFMPEWEELFERGRRRNFYYERFQYPHRYGIGTRVFLKTPAMRIPIGPLYIVEHCKSMYSQGPPQYILQPCIEGDNSKWLHALETHIFRVDENDNRID